MSFTTLSKGMVIESEHVTEIQAALKGTSGYGETISLTQLSDASNYALDVRNLGSGSLGLRIRDSADATIALFGGTTITFAKKVVLTGGTQTTTHELLSSTVTWNGAGVTFNGIKLNVTNTASAAASALLDLQVGGVSKLNVAVSGAIAAALGTVTTGTNHLGLTETWNNGAETFTGIKLVVTNTASAAASRLLDLQLSTGTRFAVDTSGNVYGAAAKWYIGDTANAKMTTGLTINQGGADDEILALKSSDVTQSATDWAEADTYGMMRKGETYGGLNILGFLDATSGGIGGLKLTGFVGQNADTAHTAAGEGIVQLYGLQSSAGAVANTVANGNLFTVHTYIGGAWVTRFIVDAEGDIFYDGAAAAYDSFEDALVVADLARVTSKREELVEHYDRAALREMGIIHYSDDDPTRIMVSHKSKDALVQGAIRQMYGYIKGLEGKLSATERRLQDVEARRP